MIESFGIPKAKVAKYAGFTSAVFSLSQCTTAVYWGRASDRFGRKPIILCGLLATMMTSVLFGMAHSFGFALTMRILAGACNGNGLFDAPLYEQGMLIEKQLVCDIRVSGRHFPLFQQAERSCVSNERNENQKIVLSRLY